MKWPGNIHPSTIESSVPISRSMTFKLKKLTPSHLGNRNLIPKPLQTYRVPSSIIKRKLSYHTRTPSPIPLSPELPQQSLRWPPRQPSFQHYCHIFYYLKYPGQVDDQPLQKGTDAWRKAFTTGMPKIYTYPSNHACQRIYLHYYCGSSPNRWTQ